LGRELVAVTDERARPGAFRLAGDVACGKVASVGRTDNGCVGLAIYGRSHNSFNIGDVYGLNEGPDIVIAVGGCAEAAIDGLNACKKITEAVTHAVIHEIGVIFGKQSAVHLGNVGRNFG
jgi:hypothetical protein